MVLTEPGTMRAHRSAQSPQPQSGRVYLLLAVGLCASAALMFIGSLESPGSTELVSRTAAAEAAEVGAVDRNHDILVQKSKVLAAKIGDLARTLKRQETSLTGSGKVPKADLTAIQDDVESITRQWKQYKSTEHIPDLKHTRSKLDDAYSKKLFTQQSQLENRAQAAFDKSARERVKSANLLQQAAKDDAQYQSELASEKKALAKLQAEKASRKEEERKHQEKVAKEKLEARKRLQRREQRQITEAVKQVRQDAKKREKEEAQEKEHMRSWGMAAQAAARGDARAVGEFCAGQKEPAACRASLLTTATAAAAAKSGARPCDPSSAGYLRSRGREGLGRLTRSRRTQVAQSGHQLMEDKTKRLRRLRNHNLHNKNWMSA